MKFTISINQFAIVSAGLHEHTDLTDWAILEYIMSRQSDPNAIRIGGRVWINYRRLRGEMPLLRLNSRQAVSKRIQKLRKLGLISVDHDSEGRSFAGLFGAAIAVMAVRNIAL